MTAHSCKVLQPDICYRCALNVDEMKEYERMSWFYDLWEDNDEFFGQPALNAATPESQLEKLGHELEELKANMGDAEEAADIMVCLLGFCIKSGMNIETFLQALDDKTQKNLARKWALQPDGTYQHIKEKS